MPRSLLLFLVALILAAMSLAAFAADNPDRESSRESSSRSSSSREESSRASGVRRSAADEQSEEETEPATEPVTQPEPIVVIRTVEVEAVAEEINRAVETPGGPVDVAAVSHMAEAGAVVARVNAAREEAGLPPLAYDGYLAETALLRSLELSLLFGHERPNGAAWHTVAGGSGDAASELIARGYPSGAAVYDAWAASPGHRAALLDGAYTRIGVSGVQAGGTFTWALTLGV